MTKVKFFNFMLRFSVFFFVTHGGYVDECYMRIDLGGFFFG